MPKTLFNKSQIFDISKNIIENHGIEKLTIKEISSRMKSSSQPIYKSYESINQIKISYLEYYKSNFLEEINRVTDDFDEVVNFIFLKCKENPFGFKSFFFDSKKFSIIADDIVTILVTKFNEFMNLKYKDFKDLDLSVLVFSLCSYICINPQEKELDYKSIIDNYLSRYELR